MSRITLETEKQKDEFNIRMDNMNRFVDKVINNRKAIEKDLAEIRVMMSETNDETLRSIFVLMSMTLLFALDSTRCESPIGSPILEEIYNKIYKLKKGHE